ncbi:LysR family transcriptional regulator [Lignipirellula cremea]|nr:LysR family transcriptional regulator [Lignipirellula cremea]
MAKTGRAYKEITFQQLRSFCETARLGSFTAAAEFLDVSHPTVWKQVHALERELGTQLLEPHGRGSRLTAAGQVLLEMAQPAVTSIGTLTRRFHERLSISVTRLKVVSTPRIIVEDLPECVLQYEKRNPRVQFSLAEETNQEITSAIETGRADLGLTASPGDQDNPRIEYGPGYQLNIYLITRDDHPLAKKRSVRPEDLVDYPIVNTPDSFPNPAVNLQLADLGLFRTQPRRVEAHYAAAIRRYVGLGFGFGLLGRLPNAIPEPGFHERDMSRYFRGSPIRFLWRRGIVLAPAAREFMETVQQMLGASQRRRGPGG